MLRVIRDILFHKPQYRGTSVNRALQFANRILPHRAVVLVLSDFLGETNPSRAEIAAHLRRRVVRSESLGRVSATSLRQVSRKHDLVAIQIVDPFEEQLPGLGRLVLQDAETGEVVEVNTADQRRRDAFAQRQEKTRRELDRLFRQAEVDAIRVRTDAPYDRALQQFFDTRDKRRRRG